MLSPPPAPGTRRLALISFVLARSPRRRPCFSASSFRVRSREYGRPGMGKGGKAGKGKAPAAKKGGKK